MGAFYLQDDGTVHEHGNISTYAALDEDDFQTVIVENKLGCDIYLKKVEQNSDAVELLRHDEHASLWVPPPRYSDRLNVVDESREARRYIAVQIIEAKVSFTSSKIQLSVLLLSQ